ncbi:oxidative phosphorylation uncoupler [Aureococcus anophagefferens]|nr:oxidative phosphorylation uncoupler [Aureococcus anophagefferens]
MNAYATLKQFGLPAVAGSLAVCVSHPLELTKFAFNCARIGSFEPALAVVGHPMAAGFLCGSLGGCVANPVEVLKVRFQALGGATGHQHAAFSNAGFWASLRRLVADEGWRACAKGLGVSTLRGALGPGTQLPAYYELKRRCAAAGLDADSPAVHGCCSAASAGVSIAFCNPADVVRTRVYNGPAGNARYADATPSARSSPRRGRRRSTRRGLPLRLAPRSSSSSSRQPAS